MKKRPTMTFPKASTEAREFFDKLLPSSAGVSVRPMFGHPAAFVNGNMFFGVFGDSVFVRLGDDERPKLLAEAGASAFEPMKGRPMREYVVLPLSWRKQLERAEGWVRRSLDWTARLPAKQGRS